MGDCDSGSALRRSAWAPWRREWHLDGCKWLTVTSALLPEHKSALVRLLPSSSLLRVTGLEGDGGLRAAAARRLAGLAADTELQKVSITSMLSAMLLLGGVDYSWHLAPSVGHSNRIAHLEEATSGCEAAPYVLVDVELLTTPASAAKVDGLLACAPRRGAFVALTTRPLVRGQSSWLNQALLPRMRARHNMSLDVISSASLRRASFCDCLSARCCAGDGAPLLFFVRDDALLSIEPSTTRPRPNRHPSRWAHERADGAAAHAGVVMAADMNYLRANLRTFELLAAQSRRLPLSLVSPNATHARREVVDAMRRVAPSGAKGGAAGGGAAGNAASSRHATWYECARMTADTSLGTALGVLTGVEVRGGVPCSKSMRPCSEACNASGAHTARRLLRAAMPAADAPLAAFGTSSYTSAVEKISVELRATEAFAPEAAAAAPPHTAVPRRSKPLLGSKLTMAGVSTAVPDALGGAPLTNGLVPSSGGAMSCACSCGARCAGTPSK